MFQHPHPIPRNGTRRTFAPDLSSTTPKDQKTRDQMDNQPQETCNRSKRCPTQPFQPPEGAWMNQTDRRPNHRPSKETRTGWGGPSQGKVCTGTNWLLSIKNGTIAPREMQQKNWGSSTSGVFSPRESVPGTKLVRACPRPLLSWASASSGISPPVSCFCLHKNSPHGFHQQPSPKAV